MTCKYCHKSFKTSSEALSHVIKTHPRNKIAISMQRPSGKTKTRTFNISGEECKSDFNFDEETGLLQIPTKGASHNRLTNQK